IADADVVLEEPLGREVLSEGTPRQVDAGQLGAPEGIVLRRIRVHGLVGPAVDGEIGLLVAVDVEESDVDAARHRRLEDRGADRLSAPDDVARSADADGDELHVPKTFVASRYSRSSSVVR